MRIFLVVALLLVIPLPSLAQTFGAEEFKLENGLQVVVIPNHRAPVVTHMIWIKAGSADEAPGVSGMAHYLEHLLFKGTEKIAPGDYSKTIKTLGGNDNAFTGQDYTAFFESVSVDNLEKVMEMEADRMTNINPPPAHYASEKAVVIEERRQRTDNDPRAKFGEHMQSVLFVNHPYAIPVIGWMSEIEKYEWADVKKFYDTWYAPNNAVVVISGDITAAQFKPLAEKYYGTWQKKELPPRFRAEVPPANGETTLRLHDADIHQPVFQRMYIAPAERLAKKDARALEVLAEIMDGTPTTRFYKSLVVDQKKATNVGFDYSGTALDYGRITMAATPAAGVTPEEVGALMEAELHKVIEQGVTEAEVKGAIQRLRDQAVFARDSVQGPAMIFGNALTTGSTVQDVEAWPQEIAKVTAADVQAAAKKYLDSQNPWIRPPVTGYLLPLAPAPAAQTKQEGASDVQR